MEKHEKAEILSRLINKCLEGTLSQEEQVELDTWLAESEENRSLFTEFTDKPGMLEKLKSYSQVNSEAIWNKTMQQINPEGKVVPFYPVQRAWWKYAAAAAVVLTLSAGAWLYLKPADKQLVADKQAANELIEEIVPGSSKAVLTLNDGQKVDLDNANDQKTIQEGDLIISESSGRLIYSGENQANGRPDPIAVGSTVLYNTVSTPKGGQYQITLPDGSIVWLNAASSLRFPIAFAGSERNVLLTGEAFFEVKPMADKPFRVAVQSSFGDGGIIEVLGTHFNVNAYTDEALVKTTLLEGSVKVITKTVHNTLKPGQEAGVDKNGQINVKKVDTADVVSWKNGYFSFKEAGVQVVMQQIARWYNIDVEYAGKIPVKSLNGKISRTYTIDDVLQILKVNGVQATLNKKERKIVVMS